MDQTKFINSYIANLAERLKALTLDNIMLNTQLTMANETVKEQAIKIQTLEQQLEQPVPSGNYVGLDGNMPFETADDYSVATEDATETLPMD
jgi:hypothetical protein